jgi:integrase
MNQNEAVTLEAKRVPGRAGGHIFLRGTTWHMAFSLRGREIRKSTKCTKLSDAHKFLEVEMRKVHADRANIKTYSGDPKIERIKVGELLDDLIANYRRNNGAQAREVSQSMRSHLKHVRAHFGDFRVVDLRRHHIESYIDSLRSQGKANATINRRTELLYRAFVLAVKGDPPKATRTLVIERQDESGNARKGKFSRHEAELVFLNAPEWLSDYFRWLHACGERAGEASQLRWSHLNADRSALSIPGNICKNREPRIVAVTPVMAEILGRRQLARIPGCDLIFFDMNGEQITGKGYNMAWRTLCVLTGLGRYVCRFDGVTLDAKKICAQCGRSGGYYPKFVGKTPHDFRRTACHEMELAGIARELAKEISGHKTDSQYMRYADLFDSQQKVARQLGAQARRREFMETVAQSDKNSDKMSGVERKLLQ